MFCDPIITERDEINTLLPETEVHAGLGLVTVQHQHQTTKRLLALAFHPDVGSLASGHTLANIFRNDPAAHILLAPTRPRHDCL